MKFSVYKHQFDVHPTPLESESWDDFCELFITEDFCETLDKSNHQHISMSVFDGYKNTEHALDMSGLILDYDDGMSVEDALDMFSSYEFLFYTSYNHQRVKNEGVAPVDKFRLIFPFVVPVTEKEWKLRKHYVTTFAPQVDPASNKFVQCYAAPCTHPDNHDNMMIFRNNGERLDWRTFPRELPNLAPNAGAANISDSSSLTLKPTDIIRLKKGSIQVSDIDKRYQCYCPFHTDKNPGAFINKKGGTTYLHCTKCGTAKYVELSNDHVSAEMFLAERKAKREQFHEFDQNYLTIDFEEEIVKPKSREERERILKKRCLRDDWEGVMLLDAFEGFGKSRLATLFAKKGHTVIFASDSNDQSNKQAQGFREQFKEKNRVFSIEREYDPVQFIPGRQYTLSNEFKLPVVMSDSANPWEGDRIDESKTKAKWKELGKSDKECDDIWIESTPPNPNFDKRIICTTMKRVQSWGHINAQYLERNPNNPYIPANTVVFFDDPGKKDFVTITPWFDKYSEVIIDGQPLQKTTINKRDYAVRPYKYSLTYGLIEQKIIFTTTEILIRGLIERQYEQVYAPKLLPDNKMDAGYITMINTDIVRSKWDGLLPPIMERLRKKNHKFNYIADGQGQSVNLVNNKGQNNLDDMDSIIEISLPEFNEVNTMIDEFGWTSNDKFAMSALIALDKMNQAIGRNSGYRHTDTNSPHRCVVLCEPKLHNALYKRTRYHIERKVDCKMDRGPRRFDDENDTMLSDIMTLIRNWDEYILSGIERNRVAFRSDAKDAIEKCEPIRRIRLVKRIVQALTHITKHKNITDKNHDTIAKTIVYLTT